MERPTLKEQIAISKLTDEECIRLLLPHTLQARVDFWLHNHFLFLWRLYHWNWFNIWTGERSFRLFARHSFREWRVKDGS